MTTFQNFWWENRHASYEGTPKVDPAMSCECPTEIPMSFIGPLDGMNDENNRRAETAETKILLGESRDSSWNDYKRWKHQSCQDIDQTNFLHLLPQL